MSLHASDAGLLAALSGACRFQGLTLPEPLPAEPFAIFTDWMADAKSQKVMPNPNSMTLATVDPDGNPSARIVLCRGVKSDPGFITFYTNYTGKKGTDLDATRKVAVVFHWDALERQVRIEGPVTRATDAESDAYFNTRPKMSRIAAWASDQSAPLASRKELEEKQRACEARFGVRPGVDPEKDPSVIVPRPPHWGGFRIWVRRMELWLGHPNRLHDRAVWTRTLEPETVDGTAGFKPGPWSSQRLQP